MGLYDKYARLAGERLQFSDNGLTPFGTCIDEVYSATEGRIGNKKVILAGTNNYLGLTFNHDAISEGQAALAAQGTGTTGSRMANGSYAPHLALEKEIAEFFKRPTAIVFSTGYTANLGVISALADHNAVVLLDADSHASIYDACSLGGAEIIRFRHNDAKDLERRMVRLGERAKEAIIIVEGIYSMLGDVAPLAALKMMWILSLAPSVKVWPRLAVLLSVRKRWKCCATAAARIFLPPLLLRPPLRPCARR